VADTILINQPTVTSVIETQLQGLPGVVDYSLTLTVANRLAELDTEQKKADARANLDLTVIDGGTFN
jgi:uncharacterized phage protein gp47/JayE